MIKPPSFTTSSLVFLSILLTAWVLTIDDIFIVIFPIILMLSFELLGRRIFSTYWANMIFVVMFKYLYVHNHLNDTVLLFLLTILAILVGWYTGYVVRTEIIEPRKFKKQENGRKPDKQ